MDRKAFQSKEAGSRRSTDARDAAGSGVHSFFGCVSIVAGMRGDAKVMTVRALLMVTSTTMTVIDGARCGRYVMSREREVKWLRMEEGRRLLNRCANDGGNF